MTTNMAEESKRMLVHEEGRGDLFNPADIRVLAIDANVVSLTYLVAILHKCQYKVTSTTIAAEALKILRENKNNHHIVITDVKRLDMDGFKLVEIIGLEMDLPVIMISAEDSKSSIMKGIRHGARDYLLKPVRIQEIKNIWQHVLRKRLSHSCDKSSDFSTKDIMEQESALLLEKTRTEIREVKEKEIIDDLNGDPSTGKKHRVTWSPELHLKFVDCIQQLEAHGERVHPKRIRQMMSAEGLSRENIASHLQKYRNLLKKHRDKSYQPVNHGIDLNRYRGISASKNDHLCSTAAELRPISQSPISSLTNSKHIFYRPSNHNVFQDNSLSSNMLMQQGILNHGTGNSSATALTLFPVPEFKGLNFSASSSTWNLPNNCIGSQFLGCNPDPYNMSPFLLCPADSFYPSFPLLGLTSVDQMSPASVLSSPKSFPGQHERGVSNNICGGGNLVFGGQANASQCANREQKQLVVDLENHEEAKQCVDEEISEMVKQFNNDVAPRL